MPIVTEDNSKIAKKLADGFKFSLYWNKYKMIPNEKEEPPYNGTSNTRKLISSCSKGIGRLFILVYDHSSNNNDADTNSRVKAHSHNEYLLPRVNIENCNIEIDGRSLD